MKTRMILPAMLAVGLFCLIGTSSANAGLFGRGCAEPSCGCEAAPACGCEATCEPTCCASARWSVGPPEGPLRREEGVL